MESIAFPQCEQPYNLPHRVLVFIFTPSILFEKKADYDKWITLISHFILQLGCCHTDMCLSVTSSSFLLCWILSGVFCLFIFALFCKERTGNIEIFPGGKRRRVIIQSDLMNKSLKKSLRFKVKKFLITRNNLALIKQLWEELLWALPLCVSLQAGNPRWRRCRMNLSTVSPLAAALPRGNSTCHGQTSQWSTSPMTPLLRMSKPGCSPRDSTLCKF